MEKYQYNIIDVNLSPNDSINEKIPHLKLVLHKNEPLPNYHYLDFLPETVKELSLISSRDTFDYDLNLNLKYDLFLNNLPKSLEILNLQENVKVFLDKVNFKKISVIGTITENLNISNSLIEELEIKWIYPSINSNFKRILNKIKSEEYPCVKKYSIIFRYFYQTILDYISEIKLINEYNCDLMENNDNFFTITLTKK